jgi:Trk-type K+ transport system membrane component
LIVLILCGVGAAAAKLLRNSPPGPEHRFAIIVLAATVGIALNSATAVPFNCMVLAYLFFWMAGVTVTQATGIFGQRRR